MHSLIVNRYSVLMRILHTIHSIDPVGGGPIEFIRQLAPLYNRDGHDLIVATMDTPDSPFIKEFPGKVVAFGPSTNGYGFSSGYLPWLQKERQNFDATIVHGLWQYPGLGTWQGLHDSRTPYLVFPHGMLDPWFQKQYPLKHLKKSLYWRLAEHKVLRDAAAVLFTAEDERVNARDSFQPYECREVVVGLGCSAPSGNREQQAQTFLSAYENLKNKRIVLFLGRIHEKKGCDLLLQAFSKAQLADQNIELVMAGPDNDGYANELKTQVPASIRNRITWTGMLVGDLKWGAIYCSEGLILPSHQENFGIVVAEALACGKPVLLSNKVNTWREILAEDAGLVATDDLEGTEQLLLRWFKMTDTEREKMQANARPCFEKHFEISAAYARINATIEQAIERQPNRQGRI